MRKTMKALVLAGAMLAAACEAPPVASVMGKDQAGVVAALGKPDSVGRGWSDGPKHPVRAESPTPTVLKDDSLYVCVWYSDVDGQQWFVFLAAESSLKRAATPATLPAGPEETVETMRVVEIQKYPTGAVF